MSAVWKFPIPVSDVVAVEMPASASLLHVGEQYGDLCVWALVNPGAVRVTRELRVVGTGNPTDCVDEEYVGTVVTRGGDLVWHVFDRGEMSA